MAVYWLSFRLAEDSTYSERYTALNQAIDAMCSQWWFDTSSFFVFESDLGIDQVAVNAKAAVNPSKGKDIVLIGMSEFKSTRLIGVPDYEAIFGLMPFTKKV